jgi:murein DD-endopeptidase MepM/ murein hydrolase activator NlpD
MPFFLLLLFGGGAVAAAAAAAGAKRRWETDVGEDEAVITFTRRPGAAPRPPQPQPQPSRIVPFTIKPVAKPAAPKEPTGVVAAGRFTGKYGTKRSGTHIHKGIDISAKKGTPVQAINKGVVQALYPDGVRYGYGNAILLKHPDGKRSFYAHLNGFAVQPGQSVRKGETIGYVGATHRHAPAKRSAGYRGEPAQPHGPAALHEAGRVKACYTIRLGE